MNNKLGDVTIRFIAQAIGGVCQIRRLNLTNTKMTYKGCHNIFNGAARASKLRELILDQNVLDGSKLRVIRETIITNKKLEVLHMNDCQLGEDGAYYFAQGLQVNTTLQTLNIASNNFGDEGVKNIAQLMAAHGYHLQHFDLSNNFISDEVGCLLAEGLLSNSSLVTLSLSDNTLTDKAGQALLDSVKLHPTLSKVDLSKNLIPIKYILEIKKHCDTNTERTDPK